MLSPRSPDLSDENNHKGKTSVRVGENVNVFVYKKSPQGSSSFTYLTYSSIGTARKLRETRE